MDVVTQAEKLVKYTQAECRSKAASKLSEAQTLVLAGDAVSAGIALQCSQVWATLALSAPKHEAPATPESQTIPGVQLFSADSPEPDINPGEILVDPSGRTYPYLLRLDGHKWLWCDSLAHAEAQGFGDARSCDEVMAGGLHRVRRATEREQIEFRNDTGGAALDLVRRLLSTLAGLAHDNGHEHIALWLANCDERAHLSFSAWEWPPPAPAAPQPPSASYDVGQALARAAELADAAGKQRTAAWLRACAMAYGRGQKWPDAPKCRTLVSESDLDSDVEQLPVDMLVRLRDRVQATLTKRGSTRTHGERWRAGTGGGIPDYPGQGGGATQWREG